MSAWTTAVLTCGRYNGDGKLFVVGPEALASSPVQVNVYRVGAPPRDL
jgi:hypothetical protein